MELTKLVCRRGERGNGFSKLLGTCCGSESLCIIVAWGNMCRGRRIEAFPKSSNFDGNAGLDGRMSDEATGDSLSGTWDLTTWTCGILLGGNAGLLVAWVQWNGSELLGNLAGPRGRVKSAVGS